MKRRSGHRIRPRALRNLARLSHPLRNRFVVFQVLPYLKLLSLLKRWTWRTSPKKKAEMSSTSC